MSTAVRDRESLTFWNVDLERPSDARDILLLKHIRAEEGDVAKAGSRLANTLVYRAENNIDVLVSYSLEEAFGKFAEPYSQITKFGRKDRMGRPVVVTRTVNEDAIIESGELFTKYCFWVREQILGSRTFAKNRAEDICMIVDVEGSRLNSNAVVREAGKQLTLHCPETNGLNIFINVPHLFGALYRAAKVFIPLRTQERTKVLGQNDHMSLFTYVRPECLPVEVGGMLQQPRSCLRTSCHAVEVRPGCTEAVDLMHCSSGPLLWELRVCAKDIVYELTFVADGGQEVIVNQSPDGGCLQASQGVIAGRWVSPGAGWLRVHFHNRYAWFENRVCCCRAAAE